MEFHSIDSIRQSGFQGFVTISVLQTSRCREVPDKPGVYFVLRPNEFHPVFLGESRGGHFKGKDPTVAIPQLEHAWIQDALVLNIGKAGGPGKKVTLRSRLLQYMRYGQGKAVGHRGGRYIWQLDGSGALVVCWKPIAGDDPRTVEKELIREFTAVYGRRPFANLAD